MPDIQAFRGLRYDLGHVGSLSDVVAPPYDVISPELQDALYKKHPANVIRLILNREEPGDDSANNRYARAAKFLKNWRREGVLFSEPDPAVYVYHQTFDYGGQTFTRRGVMASHLEPAYRDAIRRVPLPMSEEADRSAIVLPLFHALTTDDQDRVIEAVLDLV